MTGINSLIYVASTIPPWYLVDIWGRRFILMSGAAVMCAALASTGWWIYVDQAMTPNAVVVCVVIFNAAFGFSWGPIPWLYPPEIMPLTVRAKGVSLSTATNWFFNFIVGEGTPVLQELIGWRLYTMHAFFCACSLILVYFLYPETMGIPLEEMDAIFGEDPLSDDEDDDDEGTSETATLVRRDSTSRRSYTSPERAGPRSPDSKDASPSISGSRGWIASLTGAGRSQTAYKPVRDGGDGERDD